MAKFKQARNWCFTSFSRTINYNAIYAQYSDIIRYIVAGDESCPKTGKKHHQGWIQFHNKKTMGGVKRTLKDKTVHLEPCRGSEYQNDKYCKKDSNFIQLGKFITQGHRSDLEDIKNMIDQGKTMKNIADSHFGNYLRYHTGFSKYAELVAKEKAKSNRDLEVILLTGQTGTGKTRLAMKESTFKINANNLKWWDGYEGDKTIVIDEFANQVPITQMLDILDIYTLRLPIKGGHTYALWNKVYITTNLEPEEFYPNAKKEHRRALFRRITKVAKVTEGNTMTSVSLPQII